MSDEHEAMVADLTRTLRGRPGLIVFPNIGIGGGFADVLAYAWRGGPPPVAIYEVKVTRADFDEELKSGKWRGAWGLCNQFYFACDTALGVRHDLPVGAGLITRGKGGGWRITRAAAMHRADQWTWREDYALLMKAHYGGTRDDRPRDLGDLAGWQDRLGVEAAARRAGRDLAEQLPQLVSRERAVAAAMDELQDAFRGPGENKYTTGLASMVESFRGFREAVAVLLGHTLTPGWAADSATWYELKTALQGLLPFLPQTMRASDAVLDEMADMLKAIAGGELDRAEATEERLARHIKSAIATRRLLQAPPAADDQPALPA